MKKIFSIIILVAFVVAFAGLAITPVSADSNDVTVTWIVPADTTLTLSYPTGEGKIEFDSTGIGKTFSDLGATGQAADTAAIRIQNDGNTIVSIDANIASFPTNVTHVNFSQSMTDNNSGVHYGSGNCSDNQTWTESIAIGGQEDFWAWSSGANVEETAGVDKTLKIYAVND